MKKFNLIRVSFSIWLFLFGIFNFSTSYSQGTTTITTNGKSILGPCGDTLVLIGVNYAPYNWGWSPNSLNIDQIALTGANCVRIAWYVDAGNPTPTALYNDPVRLDSVLSKCIQNKMIPILELHDETCSNDSLAVINMANWFTQANNLALIDKYKHSLILNIANEALYVMWTGNQTVAQQRFINIYSEIVSNLRTNNINVPLLIDAPDCGQNLELISDVAADLILADPLHNLIFSSHAYWYSYANNDSLDMLAEVDNAISKNIPFLFGEIANLQDDVSMCQYTLNYHYLLNICKAKKIGWLAWSWDNDGCAARQMSSNGNFSSLTSYGVDLVNNPDYGIAVQAPEKSHYFIDNNCIILTAEESVDDVLYIFPNPSNGKFTINKELPIESIEIFDLFGRSISFTLDEKNLKINDEKINGLYILSFIMNNKRYIQRIIITN